MQRETYDRHSLQWSGRPGFHTRSRHTKDFKKWYDIRYVSRVKWSNPGKGVAPSPTPRCSSYWKGSFQVALDYGCQLYFYLYMNRSVLIGKQTPSAVMQSLIGLKGERESNEYLLSARLYFKKLKLWNIVLCFFFIYLYYLFIYLFIHLFTYFILFYFFIFYFLLGSNNSKSPFLTIITYYLPL